MKEEINPIKFHKRKKFDSISFFLIFPYFGLFKNFEALSKILTVFSWLLNTVLIKKKLKTLKLKFVA